MTPPDFWYDPTKPVFFLKRFFLWVLSLLIYAGGRLRTAFIIRKKSPIPVICIGNFTVGGAGKTPTTLYFARYFKDLGMNVSILSRGYRGRLQGPLFVDPSQHSVFDVGDEPLMMAHYYPVYISRNRYQGAMLAAKNGADIILMDDGLQHPRLYQDFKISVIDAKKGFGNLKLLPAGPLREPLDYALKRVDAFVSISTNDKTRFHFDRSSSYSKPKNTPHFRAVISINDSDRRKLKGKKLMAFAGLAHPDKFFTTLSEENFNVLKKFTFPDHHFYTNEELDHLKQRAESEKAHLVTTEKDWVRLPKKFQNHITPLRITLEFENPDAFKDILAPFVKKIKKVEK